MSAAEPRVEADLRIVELALVSPHEDHDERRIEDLAARIQRDGVIRNPPIVAELDGSRFVVLDGANRTSALRLLDYPHVIVQVVDYAAVELSTWNHLVVDFQEPDLAGAIEGVEGLDLVETSRERAEADLRDGRNMGALVLPDGRVFGFSGALGVLDQVECLRRVVGLYNGRSNIHRVRGSDIRAAGADHMSVAGLVVFPRFTPGDLIGIVRAGSLLPSGISRHVIPGRALRIDYSLAELASGASLDDKNGTLRTWIRRKQQAGEIRYYEEPTILFDE